VKRIVLTRAFLEWRREFVVHEVDDDFDVNGDIEVQLSAYAERGEDTFHSQVEGEPIGFVEADNYEYHCTEDEWNSEGPES